MHKLMFRGDISRSEFDARCCCADAWYHSYYFTNGYEKRGSYNVGADVEQYGFPADLKGLTVLDVGVAAGWFSYYFEERGASVTAVDIRVPTDRDTQVPGPTDDARPPDRFHDGQPVWIERANAPFWILHDLFRSSIRFVHSTIYQLGRQTLVDEEFDLVFAGSVFQHLRDPIGALQALRRVCRGRTIVATPVTRRFPEQAVMLHMDNRNLFWTPNAACFEKWFERAGFREHDISRSTRLRKDADDAFESSEQLLRLGVGFV